MSSKVRQNTEINIIPGGNSPLLLDTLAQLLPATEYQAVIKSVTSLSKKAVAKYQTNKLVCRLIDLESDLHNYYWQSWHCNNILLQKDNVITGHYCNGRACVVCGRIRTAKMINGYLPVIKTFKHPMFVTLTIPNVSAQELKGSIAQMNRAFALINYNFRYKKGILIKGLRKIEVEPAGDHPGEFHQNEFNQHFHLIIDGNDVAKKLVNAWLVRFPDAELRGQNIRPADNDSLIELFKYTTKLVAKKKNDAVKLDTIFQALFNKRCYQPIGIKKYVSEDVDEIQSQEIEDLKHAVDVWTWEQEVSDWVNSSGEGLSGCQEYKKDKGELCQDIPKKRIFNQDFPGKLKNEVSYMEYLEKAISVFETDIRVENEDLKKTISAFEADIRPENSIVVAKNINTGKPIYNKKEVCYEDS